MFCVQLCVQERGPLIERSGIGLNKMIVVAQGLGGNGAGESASWTTMLIAIYSFILGPSL